MTNQQTTHVSKLFQDQLRATWCKLSEQEFRNYDGRREYFFSSLKDKYGLTQEDAEKQIAGFSKPDINSNDHSAILISSIS